MSCTWKYGPTLQFSSLLGVFLSMELTNDGAQRRATGRGYQPLHSSLRDTVLIRVPGAQQYTFLRPSSTCHGQMGAVSSLWTWT